MFGVGVGVSPGLVLGIGVVTGLVAGVGVRARLDSRARPDSGPGVRTVLDSDLAVGTGLSVGVGLNIGPELSRPGL